MRYSMQWRMLARLVGCMMAGFALRSALVAASAGSPKEILVVSDASAPPQELRPKPERPIRYVLNSIEQSLGEIVDGEKIPSATVIERATELELKKQGFVRATVDGIFPEVSIVVIFGASNFADPEKRHSIASVHDTDWLQRYLGSQRAVDQVKLEALVGLPPSVATPRGNMRTALPTDGPIGWVLAGDRYYVAVCAYDAKRLLQKEKVLLWRTSMFIDARQDFTKGLPIMLAQAGPLFGVSTANPASSEQMSAQPAAAKQAR
jgi:hypothetical protein